MLSRNGSSFIAAVVVIFAIAVRSETTAQPSPPVVTQDSKLPAGDPCKLLTLAEVRKVSPNAPAGTRDDDIYNGILRCTWRSPDGTIRLSLMDTEPGDTIAGELDSYAMGFVTDIEKWEAVKQYVVFGTPINFGGEGAMIAVVQKASPEHFLRAGAMLVAHRREETILLEITPDLVARGRNGGADELIELGGAAVKRL